MLLPKHAEVVYDQMCRYLIENDWRREDDRSGWWWKDEAPSDMGLGEAVAWQLDRDGLDLRDMRSWEPQEFWG